jgi:hypothetical protein
MSLTEAASQRLAIVQPGGQKTARPRQKTLDEAIKVMFARKSTPQANVIWPSHPARGEGISATVAQSAARHERKILGPANSANGKVNVQARPIEVIWSRTLNVGDLRHRGLFKPGELLIGQQQLLVAKEHPEAMARDVGDLSRRSDGSMHLRFPSCVLEQRLARQ